MQSCMSGGGTHSESWPNLEGESGTKSGGHGYALEMCHGSGGWDDDTEMSSNKVSGERYFEKGDAVTEDLHAI